MAVSAAGAAGAFSGHVDKPHVTEEEMNAVNKSRKLFKFGRALEAPIDAQAQRDMQYMDSPQAGQQQAGIASAGVMKEALPQVQQDLSATAQRSGGPGSGAWVARLGTDTAGLQAANEAAAASGQLGAVQEGVARKGQFLARQTGNLAAAMPMITGAAGQAAGAQQNRIQAQVNNNIQANQGAGAIGGMLIGAGSGLMGKTGGAGGGAQTASTGTASPGTTPKAGTRSLDYLF